MKNKSDQAEQSASKLGKFNTADDLLSAYNALEIEFTKRCQLIKELQTALAEKDAQAAEIAQVAPEKCDTPSTDIAGINADMSDALNADDGASSAPEPPRECANACGAHRCEDCGKHAVSAREVLETIAANVAEFAERLSELPEIESVCIARYKQRLLDGRTVVAPSGYAVITPAKRPKTLTDAKRLADTLLTGN